MRILLTGCAGFIGARVASLLLDGGHEVTGIDALRNSSASRLQEWRLGYLTDRPGFTFYRVDPQSLGVVDVDGPCFIDEARVLAFFARNHIPLCPVADNSEGTLLDRLALLGWGVFLGLPAQAHCVAYRTVEKVSDS